MKRTIAMFYRFIFILISVWGISQKLGANILVMSPNVLDFSLFINFLSLICILLIFVSSITHYPKKILLTLKSILTLSSVLIIAANFNMIFESITTEWILTILLPLMLIIDWLIFDKKGTYDFNDILVWLLGVVLGVILLAIILKVIFNVDGVFNVIGLFTNFREFLSVLFVLLFAGVLLYIYDCLVLAFKKKRINKALAFLYRVLFIILEIFAFKRLIGHDVADLIYNMQYYQIFSNFLSFVCICVVLIVNLIKFKSIKKTYNPFPRLKGAFTIAISLNIILDIIFYRNILHMSFYEIIIFYIAPIMMITDFILFDTKGYFRIFDPLLWSIIPILHICTTAIILKNNPVIYEYEFVVFVFGIILIVGYIYYIIDKLLRNKQ